MYRERGELDKVDRYIGMATEQNIKLRDKWLEASIERARAKKYSHQEHFEAAGESYKKALHYFLYSKDKYGIITTYIALGGNEVGIATKSLEEAIDLSGKVNTRLVKAEDYFSEAERYLAQENTYWNWQYDLVSVRLWKGVIARIRGQLNEARNLFQSCMGKFPSLHAIARLYRELALVEHLADNKELAYLYEEKGIHLFRQLGIFEHLNYQHCYKIIDRMKREGTW